MGKYYKFRCGGCEYERTFTLGGGVLNEEYFDCSEKLKKQLKKDILKGYYGQHIKKIVEDSTKDFSFSCDEGLFQCEKCQELFVNRRKCIIGPLSGEEHGKSIDFKRKCPRCTGMTMVYKTEKLICPKCKKTSLNCIAIGHWM